MKSAPAARMIGTFILFVAAAVAFGLNVARAESEGVFTKAPIWVLDAVPAALTNMFAASAPRYTISNAVADAYFGSPRQRPESSEAVNSAIASVARHDFLHAKPGYALLGPDDKGIVDFVEFAFRLFGLRIQSVATAYYALLLLGALLFCWRYWNNGWSMAALVAILFAEFQVLPYLVFNPQLASPLALRCLPILSAIPCAHCVLHFSKIRISAADVVAASLQALIILFVLNMRSTGIWQPLLLLGLGILLALRWWRRGRRGKAATSLPCLVRSTVPALAMVLGLAALGAYHALAFPPEYSGGEQIRTRVMWHNIYSGFALEPRLASEHVLRIDDWSIFADVGRDLTEQGKLDVWRQIGGETPNFSGIKFALYDRLARNAMFRMCGKETLACLEAFVIYKPYYFVDTLLWFYGLKNYPSVTDAFVSNYFGDIVKRQVQQATASLKKDRLTALPWGSGFIWLLPFVAVGALLVQAGSTGQQGADVFLALAVVALASTTPSLVGYPAPHGMADAVVAINAALELAMVAGAVQLLRRFAEGRLVKSVLRLQPRRA